jgi:hypothetical protein
LAERQRRAGNSGATGQVRKVLAKAKRMCAYACGIGDHREESSTGKKEKVMKLNTTDLTPLRLVLVVVALVSVLWATSADAQTLGGPAGVNLGSCPTNTPPTNLIYQGIKNGFLCVTLENTSTGCPVTLSIQNQYHALAQQSTIQPGYSMTLCDKRTTYVFADPIGGTGGTSFNWWVNNYSTTSTGRQELDFQRKIPLTLWPRGKCATSDDTCSDDGP